eukprot:1159052-Pelagomonas_calceolata.AAC.11
MQAALRVAGMQATDASCLKGCRGASDRCKLLQGLQGCKTQMRVDGSLGDASHRSKPLTQVDTAFGTGKLGVILLCFLLNRPTTLVHKEESPTLARQDRHMLVYRHCTPSIVHKNTWNGKTENLTSDSVIKRKGFLTSLGLTATDIQGRKH